MKALPKGVLLSTEKKGAMNTMVIGWGALGTNWGKPVLTVYVRESRLTRDYLDASGEFTVNVPLGAVDPEIIKVCGSKSGRDLDKIKTLSLTVQQGETVKAPAFKELPLTFECKVLFRHGRSPGKPGSTGRQMVSSRSKRQQRPSYPVHRGNHECLYREIRCSGNT